MSNFLLFEFFKFIYFLLFGFFSFVLCESSLENNRLVYGIKSDLNIISLIDLKNKNSTLELDTRNYGLAGQNSNCSDSWDVYVLSLAQNKKPPNDWLISKCLLMNATSGLSIYKQITYQLDFWIKHLITLYFASFKFISTFTIYLFFIKWFFDND